MGKVHIYGLHDPRDDELRYVGKTKYAIEERLNKGHMKDALKSDKRLPVLDWIRKLDSFGLKPICLLFEEVPEEEWVQAEKFWIAYTKMVGCKLLNLCDGGRGTPNLAQEARDRISKSLTGRKASPEQRAKISKAMKNRYFSHEHRKRISEALTGRRHPPEVLAKIGAASKGRKRSPEAIRKTGEANRKLWADPQHRKNRRTIKGHKFPPENYDRHRGEKNTNARNTEEDVREIRRLYAGGGYSYRMLAGLFDIDLTTVGQIIKRQTWKHILD